MREGGGKMESKCMFIIRLTRCTRDLLPFNSSWKYSCRVCNANSYLYVTGANACTHISSLVQFGQINYLANTYFFPFHGCRVVI